MTRPLEETNSAPPPLPEVAYYYPEPYWLVHEGDRAKTLLLFFDEIAILLPRYMRGRPEAADPTLAGPLSERGLLRILEPEQFVDQAVTEALASAMVELIVEGAFDDLERPRFYAELSRSRMGWDADVELADMLIDELRARDLARPSEDGLPYRFTPPSAKQSSSSWPNSPERLADVTASICTLSRTRGWRWTG